jgi:hypothetical protein
MMTQAGWRSASRSWRRKTSIVSWMKDMSATPWPSRQIRSDRPGPRVRPCGSPASRHAASARSG